jgi:hypothetical protein
MRTSVTETHERETQKGHKTNKKRMNAKARQQILDKPNTEAGTEKQRDRHEDNKLHNDHGGQDNATNKSS